MRWRPTPEPPGIEHRLPFPSSRLSASPTTNLSPVSNYIFVLFPLVFICPQSCLLVLLTPALARTEQPDVGEKCALGPHVPKGPSVSHMLANQSDCAAEIMGMGSVLPTSAQPLRAATAPIPPPAAGGRSSRTCPVGHACPRSATCRSCRTSSTSPTSPGLSCRRSWQHR